jgi:hypothetical protein
MNKIEAIRQVYIITTLTEPSERIIAMLATQEFDRVLELLLILRLARNVRNPEGFLRRGIQEHWTADTQPQKVSRKQENIEERIYRSMGYTERQAHDKVVENRNREVWK